MRQQLFGQQYQREAEQRLLRALGGVHARLAGATGGASGAPATAKTRAGTLNALVAGANLLIAWHHDEVLAERTAGRVTSPLPDTAPEILAEVQAASALFESAHAAGQVIDCADVITSVAALRGVEGDALFNEALAGAAAMLMAAFEHIATDPSTAPAAIGLGETWAMLLADVEGLAVAIPEPVPDLTPEPVPTLALERAPAPAPDRVPDGAPKPSFERVLERAPANFTDLTPILAARFSRIQLVAC